MSRPIAHQCLSHPTHSLLCVYRLFLGICVSRRFLSWCVLPVTAMIVHTMLSSPATAAAETVPIWQLTPGQNFSVQATTHRITEIHIGDHHDITDVTDRVTLHYTMFAFNQAGIAQFEVRIVSLERTITSEHGEKTTQSLILEKALKVPAVAVLVTDHGNDVKVLGGDSLFRADMPQSHRVLTQISDDEVFCSWLDLPFHVPVITDRPPFRSPARLHPTDDVVDPPHDVAHESLTLRTGSQWTRVLHISLGLPGTIECNCAYTIDAIEDFAAQLAVTGTIKLIPREPDEESPLRFKNFHLTESAVSGEGKILMDDLTGLPRSIEQSQRLTLEGQSAVASGGGSYDFRFKQSLTQTSIASEFGIQDLKRGVPRGVSP